MGSEARFENAEAVGPKGWASRTASKGQAGIGLSGAARFGNPDFRVLVRIPAKTPKFSLGTQHSLPSS